MEIIEFFVIKHKETGKFMPARIGLVGGWSGWEPTNKYQSVKDSSPRLFRRRADALRAATSWVKGTWVRETISDGSWEEGYVNYKGTPYPEKSSIPRSNFH